ncbi:MAG: mannonate dehydratase [Sphingobacteriaceae bacterium]
MNETKKFLEQTWRWYGPEDPVSLNDVKQAGASGIVTALHHIPHGEVWPVEEIMERKRMIADAGLRWSVVESVPVHEAIKTWNGDAEHYVNQYKLTLENLSQCGIHTVCYNFMPVLDWTRTRLDLPMANGAQALYYDSIDLAVFDLFILLREGAKQDHDLALQEQAKVRWMAMSAEDKTELEKNILMGIPGEENISLESLKDSIAVYDQIGREGLKSNLFRFLAAIAEVCETGGIQMTIHPDDPPYSILGLPRIISNAEDLQELITRESRPFNGICFCTGSLGAGADNDLPQIFNQVRHRVYFAHLRNVKRDANGSFYEADHLDGDVDMYQVLSRLVAENQQRNVSIPFRPDHGHQMLDDLHKTTNPGYSAIGRLRGLAELRGLELGILGA